MYRSRGWDRIVKPHPAGAYCGGRPRGKPRCCLPLGDGHRDGGNTRSRSEPGNPSPNKNYTGKTKIMILITGFSEFRDFKDNPAGRLAEALGKEFGYDYVILPVSRDRSVRRLKDAYKGHKFILSFGLAAGRNQITPERFAVNRMDGKDVDGEYRYGPIDDGPAARMTDISIHKLVETLKKNGIPAKESYHAGAYLCNYVYYHALSLSRSLFVHIPADFNIGIKKDIPSRPFEKILEAGRIILREIEKLIP